MISKLKKGTFFDLLLILKINLLYRYLWRISDYIGSIIYAFLNKACGNFLDSPLSLLPNGKIINNSSKNDKNWPLSEYSWRSFYSMRTDALDRFGTTLERRISKRSS